MTKEMAAFVTGKTKELMAAISCCPEAKAAAEAWLAAVGTDHEKEETEKYLKELEEDITPIDGLIAFASSPAAAAHFGEENAKKFLVHAKEIKAAGAKYCDCPACTAALAILDKKAELL